MKTEEETYSEMQKIFKEIEKEGGISNSEGKIIRVNRRWVMLDTSYLPFDALRELDDLLGPVSHTILYRMGERCGRVIYDRYANLGFDRDTCLRFVIAGAWYFGWGLVDLEIKEDHAKVRIYNSFEAESNLINNDINPENSCHAFRGVIAGVWSRYRSGDWSVTEPKCKARGDEYCEFILKPDLESKT
jgi:predicted hydrocarbon binding protein